MKKSFGSLKKISTFAIPTETKGYKSQGFVKIKKIKHKAKHSLGV